MTRYSKFSPAAQKCLAYQDNIGYEAGKVIKKPYTCPVWLRATFYFKGKRRADLSNLIKAIEDGLNGIAYEDDKQIVRLEAIAFEDSKAGDKIIIEVEGGEVGR